MSEDLEAIKAKAEADKARAGAEQAQAEADKAKADARSAAVAAQTAERTANDDASSVAQGLRDAERAQKVAEAGKATAAAHQGQLASVIPDLSKLQPGSLEAKGDELLFGTALAQRALDSAAKTVGKVVLDALGSNGTWRVLVTSDAALASSDAAYLDVITGLQQLEDGAKEILSDVDESAEAARKAGFTGSPLDVIGAVATAVPSVLSLLSAHRTVTTRAVTVSDLAAAAATVGRLSGAGDGRLVVHDDVRLLPAGPLRVKLEAVNLHRQKLVGRKLALEDRKADATNLLSAARTDVSGLEAELAAGSGDAATLRTKLEQAQANVREQDEQVSRAAVRIGVVDGLIGAIDAFLAALRTTAPDAAHSPLTLAALREQLHEGGDGATESEPVPWFSHVLLVKGAGGSAQQVIDDRPLWFQDKFAVVASGSITYMLLVTSDSHVLASGTATGVVQGQGTLGDRLTFTTDG